MKILKKILKTIGALIGIFLLYIIFSIAYGTITDYQPADVIPLETENKGIATLDKDSLIICTLECWLWWSWCRI